MRVGPCDGVGGLTGSEEVGGALPSRAHTKERPGEGSMGGWPSVNQEEVSH